MKIKYLHQLLSIAFIFSLYFSFVHQANAEPDYISEFGGTSVFLIDCGVDTATATYVVSEFDSSLTVDDLNTGDDCAATIAELESSGGNCSVLPYGHKFLASCDFKTKTLMDYAQVPRRALFSCSDNTGTKEVDAVSMTDGFAKINGKQLIIKIGDNCSEDIAKVKKIGGDCSVSPTSPGGGLAASCDYSTQTFPSSNNSNEVVLFDCERNTAGSLLVESVTGSTEEAKNLIQIGDGCASAMTLLEDWQGKCSVMPTSSGGGKSATCDLQTPTTYPEF